MTAKLTLAQRAVLLVAAVAVYLVNGKPSEMLREAVLTHYGNPAYDGVWIAIPHLFLYSTLTAAVAMAAWVVFSRMGWVAGPWFARLTVKSATWAVVVALALAAISLGYVHFAMPGAIHEMRFNPWLAGANLFSNLFEEVIFRGFLLAALAAVFGFWPAAVLSSIAFGAVHSQYPIELQVLVGAGGLAWCWLVRTSKSLWAPYVSHMVLDLVVDPFV
jgi:membrane protease YdiL (CAAX protease family)